MDVSVLESLGFAVVKCQRIFFLNLSEEKEVRIKIEYCCKKTSTFLIFIYLYQGYVIANLSIMMT